MDSCCGVRFRPSRSASPASRPRPAAAAAARSAESGSARGRAARAPAAKYHSSPRWMPFLNRQCSCSGKRGPRNGVGITSLARPARPPGCRRSGRPAARRRSSSAASRPCRRGRCRSRAGAPTSGWRFIASSVSAKPVCRHTMSPARSRRRRLRGCASARRSRPPARRRPMWCSRSISTPRPCAPCSASCSMPSALGVRARKARPVGHGIGSSAAPRISSPARKPL